MMFRTRPSSSHWFFNRAGVYSLLAVLIVGPVVSAQALQDSRSQDDDLELRFGVELNARFMKRADLLLLPAQTESVYIPYIDTYLDCQVLPLSSLLEVLELDLESAILAESYDGYFSVYQPEFIDQYEPYLVLTLGDEPLGDMQVQTSPNLGPYYVTYAKQVPIGSPELMDPDNKRPYGVSRITIGDYAELFKSFYEGPLESLNAAELAGRELFINNCLSCHAWEAEGLGGRFSNRTVPILTAHARYNSDYFKAYVKNPATYDPTAKMPAHPHYDPSQIDSIIQFLKATAE